MKQTYILVFTLILTGIFLQAQPRLFVDQNATGSDNGSSWADAYTDLQSALDDTAGTDIWVAAGTYVPGGGSLDTFSTFRITRSVNILGGFAGTESTPDDRIPNQNTTILSGDLGGDDIPGNNSANREDNAIHVMVADTTAGAVSLDALTITGGDAHAFVSGIDNFFYRGSGIFAQARLSVSNCIFTGNVAGSGAGVFIRDNWSAGSIFRNCTFSKNTAYGQASLFMLFTSNIEVKDCDFIENQCSRGALYPNSCDDIKITGCNFTSNANAGGFGGAFFNWQSTNIDMVDCNFTGNIANSGGAIYTDNRNTPIDNQDYENFLIQNCVFDGHELLTDGWGGGAIYAFRSSFHALDCTFKNNKAINTGGAIYNGGVEKRTLIDGCTFENNEAGGGWGGGLANYGDTTFVIVKNTTFKNNLANTSGGGATSAFGADVTYEDCQFESNRARFGAGLYTQNDYTDLTVKSVNFQFNLAENTGGGLYISGGSKVGVANSTFLGNQAGLDGDDGTGGGVFMGEDSLDLSVFNLENTIFNSNIAGSQGGGLNISNANSNIKSCLFVNNAANNIGTGGAISTNASGANEMTVTIINSTIADNAGELSGGIATWTTDTTSAQLFLQNNVLANVFLNNYAIEDGNTTVQSMGGNFSDNNSTDAILTHTADINDSNEDPGFVDPLNYDYHLLATSPLIDAGVDTGAPSEDLDGNPRVGQTDIGAYEYKPGTPVSNISEDDNSLILTPNPAFSQTTLTIENNMKGKIDVDVLNGLGQLVDRFRLNKTSDKQDFQLEIDKLEAGVHYLVLRNNNQEISKRLLKLK